MSDFEVSRAVIHELVHRFYEDMWNSWQYDVADQILEAHLRFRGSLGIQVQGVKDLKIYMRTVQSAFPDFHNAVDELIVEDKRAAARLTYTGTHEGTIFGRAGTGKRISYAGAAFFRFSAHRIAEGWVLGDVDALHRQLGLAD